MKVAIETGASLVPVFTFGESELFTAVVNPSKVRAIQMKIQKKLGIGTPLVSGRGIFNYKVGALPHRVPLHTVVGEPIEVVKKKIGEYTPEDVDVIHGAYMASLQRLYEANRARFDPEGKHPILEMI